MNRSVVAIILGIVAFLAIVVLLVRFYQSGRSDDELLLFGNVDVRQVDIGFRVNGQVSQLLFEEGDFVPKGSLMATLDQTPYDNQYKQAVANLESIKANLINSETLLKRRNELIESGGISQEDLDNATSSVAQLRGNYFAAEAALGVAADNLAFTIATAPTDGIILTRIREPGTVVKEADPVYTLSVSSPVWIRAFVSEPQLGHIFFGMEADIYTDTPDAKVYRGRIGFISPVAEFTPKTVETTQLRTDLVYRLRLYVDNPDGGLKQGMPVTVKLDPNQERPPSADVP